MQDIYYILINFARLTKDPACEISLAPTNSPNIIVKLGAIAFILFFKYSLRLSLYSANNKFMFK